MAEEEQCDAAQEQRYNEFRLREADNTERAIKARANAAGPSQRAIVWTYLAFQSILKNRDVACQIALTLHQLATALRARVCIESEIRLLHGLRPEQKLDPHVEPRYTSEQLSQAALQELVANLRREKREEYDRELRSVECYIPSRLEPKHWEELLSEAESEAPTTTRGQHEAKKEACILS